MNQIKVKVIDKDTLELMEDAKAGDYIKLTDVISVDTTSINALIAKEKENVIAHTIEEAKRNLTTELESKEKDKIHDLEKSYNEELLKLQNEIINLNNEYDKLKSSLDLKIANAKSELERTKLQEISTLKSVHKDELVKKDTTIQDLQNKITTLNTTKETEIKNAKLELEREKEVQINSLNSNIQSLKQQLVSKDNEKEIALFKLKEEKDEEYRTLEKSKEEIEQKFQNLSLQKSSLNVKKLGEELERYCDEEYRTASMAGFENCEWYKDNTAIKNEDDIKGTKADFIFKVYSSNEFNEVNLLASVCLEMKNESNVSSNKKKNSDHYKKLDEDRNKKGCEYALLVSELEWDTINDSPIKKVPGYEKMYIVRPQYMIVFLSFVYSLANKFKDLLNTTNKEKLELKASLDLVAEFEKLKETYLDKPLEALNKSIEQIRANNNQIISYANKNEVELKKIIEERINTMREKIERFNIKKLANKLNKLENI